MIKPIFPHIISIETYVLSKPFIIKELKPIDEKFIIRLVTINDYEKIKQMYSHRNPYSFKHNIPTRLNSDSFDGLAAIDSTNGNIAYISWIIRGNLPYLEEFGIHLHHGEYVVKDVFVVPEYRHKGLSTRMEQERINYCVNLGDCTKIYTQPGTKNIKGIKLYKKLGYQRVKSNKLIFWPLFGVWREFNSFIKRPFKKLEK